MDMSMPDTHATTSLCLRHDGDGFELSISGDDHRVYVLSEQQTELLAFQAVQQLLRKMTLMPRH